MWKWQNIDVTELVGVVAEYCCSITGLRTATACDTMCALEMSRLEIGYAGNDA